MLSDLDQILFFLSTIPLEIQPQFSDACFYNYMSSAPFEYNVFSYLINAIQLSIAFDRCNSVRRNFIWLEFFFFPTIVV